MRILHTSDWHLGHRLYDREQREEQQMALDWLLDTIEKEAVELLLVAGDVFDSANPPNYARRQYYDFLGKLRHGPCRHVVIVAGNHDSPPMLDATSQVLRFINIHVVGAANGEPANQLIELKDEAGELEAVVAAVPFLRDRDIHYNQAGEDEAARTKRLRAAIRDHYHQLGELMQPYRKLGIPLLTTGHLYAHGAEASEKRSKIYVGNRSNIAADDFPPVFDYVALGHIHRPQLVSNQERIRYSGSLIPLDFSEVVDDKLVWLLEAEDSEVAKSPDRQPWNYRVRSIELPVFRRLKRLEGSWEKVSEALERFLTKRQERDAAGKEVLSPWLEVKVTSTKPIPQLHEKLKKIIGDRPAELLSTQVIREKGRTRKKLVSLPKLDELSVETVFQKLCTGSEGKLPDDYPALLSSFRELENWRQEREQS